jgi:hypothetical protein
MWLQDLKQAIDTLSADFKYKFYIFKEALPGDNCVIFFTSHFTILRVYRDGKIEEVNP